MGQQRFIDRSPRTQEIHWGMRALCTDNNHRIGVSVLAICQKGNQLTRCYDFDRAICLIRFRIKFNSKLIQSY